MSTEPAISPRSAPPASPAPSVRVEYLGFETVADHREYRLRIHGADGWSECRLGIAVESFRAGRVSLQDGPDVCYQRLLRAVAAGETAAPGVITIDDAYLAGYRETHTAVPKRRSWTASPSSAVMPRRPRRAAAPSVLIAQPIAEDVESLLAEGQRVSHAVFGVGVTTSCGGGHTVVHFDEGGRKTFVTSMLMVDVLSAPHTWETGPRGRNRPCRTLAPATLTLPPRGA